MFQCNFKDFNTDLKTHNRKIPNVHLFLSENETVSCCFTQGAQ